MTCAVRNFSSGGVLECAAAEMAQQTVELTKKKSRHSSIQSITLPPSKTKT